jgi:hypothetical protein
MPISYERRDAQGLVVLTFEGEFASNEIAEVMRRHDAESAWELAMLWDLRQMTGHPTTDDLWSFSRAYAHDPQEPSRRRGPVAVVTTDIEMYRRACLYVVMARPRLDIDVFQSMDDAEQWLVNRLAASDPR